MTAEKIVVGNFGRNATPAPVAPTVPKVVAPVAPKAAATVPVAAVVAPKTPILNNATSGPTVSTVNQSKSAATPMAPGQGAGSPLVAPAPVSTYADIGKANMAADAKKVVNTAGTDLGLTDVYQSPTDAYKASIDNQRQNAASQAAQLDQQSKDIQNNTSRDSNTIRSGVETVKSQFGNNQEGFSSDSNTADISFATSAAGQQISRLEQSATTALGAVDQAKKNLAYATTSNNTTLAKQYQAELDAAEQKAQTADAAVVEARDTHTANQMATLKSLTDAGVLNGATPQQIQQYAKQYQIDPTTLQAASNAANAATLKGNQKDAATQMKSAVDNFTTLNAAGVPITKAMVDATATATGVRPEFLQAAAAGYRATVDSIQAQIKLDPQIKQAALDKANQDLSDQINGYTTNAAQNVRVLQGMYKSNASPDLIAAFKQGAGINDYSDPLTMAKLQAEQAAAKVATGNANGQAVTLQDSIDLATAQANLSQYGYTLDGNGRAVQSGSTSGNGNGSAAYVPTQSKNGITANYNNGQLNITVPPGQRYQCGAFVNRVWGIDAGGNGGMGSKYSEKQSLVDTRGLNTNNITDPSQVKVGMAFVMPIGGGISATGHTGFVATQPDANGDFMTWEANASGGKGGIGGDGSASGGELSQRHRNIYQMYGFVNPPAGAATQLKPNGAQANLTPTNLNELRKISTPDLIAGLKSGVYDLNAMPDKVKASVIDSVGSENMKDIQASIAAGPTSANSTALETGNYENAIRNAMQGKATKIVDSEVARMQKYVNDGNIDQAKSMIMSTIQTKFSPTDKEAFPELGNSIQTLDKVAKEMFADDVKGKLGQQNNLGPVFAAVGADDKQLRSINQQIKATVQQYRKAMSGTAFTESERKEYADLFPAITKTAEQNAADIETLKGVFQQKRDTMIADATGGAFNSLDAYEKSFNLPDSGEAASQPAAGGGWAGFAKAITGGNKSAAEPVTYGDYTLLPQGTAHIDSSKHINSTDQI